MCGPRWSAEGTRLRDRSGSVPIDRLRAASRCLNAVIAAALKGPGHMAQLAAAGDLQNLGDILDEGAYRRLSAAANGR